MRSADLVRSVVRVGVGGKAMALDHLDSSEEISRIGGPCLAMNIVVVFRYNKEVVTSTRLS